MAPFERGIFGFCSLLKIHEFLHGKVIQESDFGHFWDVHFSKGWIGSCKKHVCYHNEKLWSQIISRFFIL
jgi:hypothetical protein